MVKTRNPANTPTAPQSAPRIRISTRQLRRPGRSIATGHRRDGQLVRRPGRRRQKGHVNAVHRHDGGLQKAQQGGRYVPQAHGVPNEAPVLPDGGQITQHHRHGNGQLFGAAEFFHGGEELVHLRGADHHPRQQAAGVHLMHKAQKRDEHRTPDPLQRAHAPHGKQADQPIGRRPPQRVSPPAAQKREHRNQPHQRHLKPQIRRGHGAKDAQEHQRKLRSGVEKQPLHRVIPAFSNCRFSILPPAKALNAAAITVPASMANKIQPVPAARMASI